MSLREELFEWLGKLPLWQQDLARRLAGSTHLEGDALQDALRSVLAAHSALGEQEEAPDPVAIQLTDLPGPTGSTEATRLSSVGQLRGVGVVASDQSIRFAEEGLSLIYGPNAAGKSTYVGALKRVCRTVDCDTSIRGNVFASAPEGQPTATVEYTRSGERRAQRIDLNEGAETGLDALSVFDARCAELYLDSTNAVAYVPSSLAVLARLATTQDALRREIDSRMGALQRQRPVFAELDAESEAGRRVDALTAQTDVEALRTFAELSAAEKARSAEVRAALAAAAARNAQADAAAARQEAGQARAAVSKLEAFAGKVSDDQVARIASEAAEVRAAEQAVAIAADDFATLDRPGVGRDPWQRMWQAAREFVESESGSFPPAESDTCPLCLRPLDTETTGRFRHFEAHVKSSLQERVSEARHRLDASLGEIDPAQVDELHVAATGSRAGPGPGVFAEFAAGREAVRQRMLAVRKDPQADGLQPLPTIPAEAVGRWAAGREEHATTLLAAADAEGQRSFEKELAELDGRDKLAARLEAVSTWVATLGDIAALEKARTALATNRITTKQREFSTRVVTDALASALEQELSRLSCDHLPVDLQPHTRVGEMQVALRLAGAQGVPRVSDVLSEGEQRAVSLAFFFAETQLAEHAGGVIVDDPVSSLDDERRAYIATRLVADAHKRQVIVFTHDLAFMLDLLEQAERADLEPQLQGVWRLGESVGRVDQKPPFAAMKFKTRVGELEQRVARWDSDPQPRDADEAWHRVCDLYADMRTTWERAVEERLFRGVVQRFQREVKTLKLPTVEVTAELVGSINDGMTRCSFFVHDAPLGTRTALPGRTQLAADLAKLREFERATKG